MNHVEFKKIKSATFTSCSNLLEVKAEHYASKRDRLIQFKLAGDLQEITPVEALFGMMAKHTSKLYFMLKSHVEEERISNDLWDEVILDHINYLVLLRASLIEEEAWVKAATQAGFQDDSQA